MRLVIVGGSDAGVAAALRARELEPAAAVTVVLADAYPNYSICGLPFYLSREVEDWHRLAHRTAFDGIDLLLDHYAESLDLVGHTIRVRDAGGQLQTLPYDRLLVATGARPDLPDIPGMNVDGVFPLHTMGDSFAIDAYLRQGKCRKVTIVGAGYIGLEMADALKVRGVDVTVIGRSASPLPSVDQELGHEIEKELLRHAVRVLCGAEVTRVGRVGDRLVVTAGDLEDETDMVIVAPGVRPSSELAAAAGIRLGVAGAIAVDRSMRTSAPDVFAAGDCVETWHQLLGVHVYLPLGTTAHKQGRVAGENMIGGDRLFAGSLGTQVVKVFDLAIARTGLRDGEARQAGFDPVTVESAAWDHKAYYPGARELRIRITADRQSSRLLGAQILGHWQAQVAKRIDVFAAAIHNGMSVEGLNDLDLSYTPPLGSPWDAVQIAAQRWATAGR